ncbi:hypothetical protein DES40_1650 [Litorimonas taeanensis]|uniref:Lipoprotein n=1 Tax=Litorimonas taeanensis TaxID=568099 RepID=A0A420WD43_9PROT|nr:lipoprotein [Litorimonas taeanensis]RKQ68875.1 hypothetical protein DES40_1650 [Litorimonas taeanensis]
MPAMLNGTLKPLAITGLYCGLLGLSACGIKGPLETPPPVWGEEKPNPDMASDTMAKDTKADKAEKAKDDSIFDSSPIDNKNDENDIFGDSYLESDEPF